MQIQQRSSITAVLSCSSASCCSTSPVGALCRRSPATGHTGRHAPAPWAPTPTAATQQRSPPLRHRRYDWEQQRAALVDAPLQQHNSKAQPWDGLKDEEEEEEVHASHRWFRVQTLSQPQQEPVARLRAEAYYQHEHSRFVESFKKQFVSQEMESLQKRTTAMPAQNNFPQTECLVAAARHANGLEQVVGCIDIRLPYSRTGMQPAGVPVEDLQGAYILNVVTHEDFRGQGVATALMLVAIDRALHTWGACSLYTHVEADNEVAYRLYTRCGFKEHSERSKFQSAASLGRLILLEMKAPPPA